MLSHRHVHTHVHNMCIHIQKMAFKSPGSETEWVRRKRGSCLLLLSLLHNILWWEHMTSPPFRLGGGGQSTRMETQRMLLATAIAGCWYNMAAALLATAAPNLLNKRSIQWRQDWYHRGKISQWTRKRGGERRIGSTWGLRGKKPSRKNPNCKKDSGAPFGSKRILHRLIDEA